MSVEKQTRQRLLDCEFVGPRQCLFGDRLQQADAFPELEFAAGQRAGAAHDDRFAGPHIMNRHRRNDRLYCADFARSVELLHHRTIISTNGSAFYDLMCQHLDVRSFASSGPAIVLYDLHEAARCPETSKLCVLNLGSLVP